MNNFQRWRESFFNSEKEGVGTLEESRRFQETVQGRENIYQLFFPSKTSLKEGKARGLKDQLILLRRGEVIQKKDHRVKKIQGRPGLLRKKGFFFKRSQLWGGVTVCGWGGKRGSGRKTFHGEFYPVTHAGLYQWKRESGFKLCRRGGISGEGVCFIENARYGGGGGGGGGAVFGGGGGVTPGQRGGD